MIHLYSRRKLDWATVIKKKNYWRLKADETKTETENYKASETGEFLHILEKR